MIIQHYLKHFNFENYLQFLVLSIPVLLIAGLFLPDLFLTLSLFSFLIFLVIKKKLSYLNYRILYFYPLGFI